jgi:hypothetical protein
MSKETVNQETPIEEVKKVSRRGLGSARGTARLKFGNDQAKPNGLFLGHLEEVKYSTITIGEDKTGMPSFNGFEIPKLTLTFASNEEDPNKRHYVSKTFTAVESNVNTIPGGKEEWKVNSIFDWLKHVLNVYYLKGRELTDEEAAALSLTFEDFDEQGEYVSVDTEIVINAWKVLFENFENIMNRGKDGKPVYHDKNNKFIPVWLKLLRYVKSRKSWTPINNGDLSLPQFVGEGCIEIYQQNAIPSIKIDLVKETILIMNVEKPKTPNMPAVGGMAPMMGGVAIDQTMNPMGTDISSQTIDDMPF